MSFYALYDIQNSYLARTRARGCRFCHNKSYADIAGIERMWIVKFLGHTGHEGPSRHLAMVGRQMERT